MWQAKPTRKGDINKKYIKDATIVEELQKIVPSATDDTIVQELLNIDQIHVSVNHKNSSN